MAMQYSGTGSLATKFITLDACQHDCMHACMPAQMKWMGNILTFFLHRVQRIVNGKTEILLLLCTFGPPQHSKMTIAAMIPEDPKKKNDTKRNKKLLRVHAWPKHKWCSNFASRC